MTTNSSYSPTPILPLHKLALHSTTSDTMAPQVDEGYVEDTHSQSDATDASMLTPDTPKDEYYERLMSAVLALPPEQRRDFIYEVSRTLPVSHIALNKSRLDALLYFDPAFKLPAELFYAVLSELSPKDLLNAGRVNRDWRSRTGDEKLWRISFARQGWSMDALKKSELEDTLNSKRDAVLQAQNGSSTVSKKGKGRAEEVPDLERRPSRKRAREEAFSEGEPGLSPPPSRPRSRAGSNESMQGIETISAMRSPGGTVRTASSSLIVSDNKHHSRASTMAADALDEPHPHSIQMSAQKYTMLGDEVRISWPWLYKQRRRLERNWDRGHYQMFSLPHQNFTHEGHAECVYTIQHSGNHLVSGSRDKTIRKWDLSTCRRIGEPLEGHEASVLCLQFDDRPEHDIIVSGGSDSFVIIWKFSTGELIKKMTDAHSESVLNLRFDDRYIVTCSKDKTIKIWNRRAIARDSPLIPAHTLHTFDDSKLPDAHDLIEEFSLLASLTGHHAAVNAVQIYEDIIVSASGDRQIKAWNIHTGESTKTYIGHTKGIACVQFDGRRIVSGSSDNTVRIFDADKTCELACLQGHHNLVRTVQARFGDMETVSDEELQDQARQADLSLYKYMEAGGQLATASRRGARSAGSSRPQDMMSIGAHIPPGGGGSRWARIVSGSYDERVIIWKKDDDGNWIVSQQLHQNHLLQHYTRRSTARANQVPLPINYANLNAQAGGGGSSGAPGASATQSSDQMRQVQHAQHLLEQAQSHLLQVNALTSANLNSATARQGLREMAQRQADLNRRLFRMAGPQVAPPAVPQTLDGSALSNLTQIPSSQSARTVQSHLAGARTALQATAATLSHASAQQLAVQQQQQQAQQHAQAQQQPQQQPQQQQQPAPANANGAAPAPANPAAPANVPQRREVVNDSSRVFKLQFDARRIICCSQNKVIVGWDFANGDPDLECVGDLCTETP